MFVRVIIPPDPVVTPSDIAGSHAPDDAAVAAMIAAATEEIDGPTGWLGRCLGQQTLEAEMDQFRYCDIDLPCPPIIGIVSVTYLDSAGVRQTVPATVYEKRPRGVGLRSGQAWPSVSCRGSVRIQYQAGYNGSPVSDTKTGEVPARVKQAIIMAVQNMKSLGAENLFLRSEEVEGVGSRSYTVSDQAGAIIRDTARRLLSGLKVPRI